MTQTAQPTSLDEVVIRFAGDSGDGMQLVGNQFSNTSALAGNDLSTFPDYPAEIRAPVGTTFGVSGFQVRFASKKIHTPGDHCDVLVAMNPAAFKVHVEALKPGGILLVNTGNFDGKNLKKAGYETSPLEDMRYKEQFNLVEINLNTAVIHAVEGTGLSSKDALRSKNILALGMLYWVYSRSLEPTEQWLKEKFSKKPMVLEANLKALHAGVKIAENSELLQTQHTIAPAPLEAGAYKNLMGNAALSMGLVAGAELAELPLFLGSYPITPASDILHYLARYKNYGVVTFQAEDEIAAIAAAIGASFSGSLGVTATSGPGIALKSEAMGLAVMTELPLLVINVQRGGPSTGLPTKTEQADLLQALFGRHGECPVPVIAPYSSSDCFHAAIEAIKMAVQYMTPVILLSDASIANGAEPFLIPDLDSLEKFPAQKAKTEENFMPYRRDEKTLARPWAVPGTPGLEHRIGGLEKSDGSGDIDYSPKNHETMVGLRNDKVQRIANTYAPLAVYGEDQGDLLVVGWGSTYGAIRSAVRNAQSNGQSVSHVHLRNLWPLPLDLQDILKSFSKVLIPEMNSGQLLRIVRSEYLIDAVGYSKIQGQPFATQEIYDHIQTIF